LRGFGICADGLFFLDDPHGTTEYDYVWHFYNRDGSKGEMCGNASRCAAKLAYSIGMAPAEHTFGTQAGSIIAKVLDNNDHKGEIEVLLPRPENRKINLQISIDGELLLLHYVKIGVPHVVVFVDDVKLIDVLSVGSQLCHHEHFGLTGTNVNFVQILDRQNILLRTYERGVNNETYACGTGAAAAQFFAAEFGFSDKKVTLTTRGGEILSVKVQDKDIYLQGDAVVTFRGEFYLKSMGLILRQKRSESRSDKD